MKTYHHDAVPLILGAFLSGELALPWGLVWLSNQFSFDITPDMIWAAFGAPAVFALAALSCWLLCSFPHRHAAPRHMGVR